MTRARESTKGAEGSWLTQARSERWTEQIAEGVLRAQQAEGSSLWAFCQRHGLSYARERFWKQRQGRTQQPLSFVPVSVSAGAPLSERGEGEVELEVSGVRIQVREGASQQLIGRVVRTLQEAVSC